MAEAFIFRWTNKGGKAAVVCIHHPYALDLVANRNAPAAENAFGAIPDDGCTGAVDDVLRLDPFEPESVDLDLFAQVLKFTVLVAVASQAIFWMIRKNQFVKNLSYLPDFGCVGVDYPYLNLH